ncbi:hypothetical protein TSUD_195740 [Trifolium subterraneum]|nr:hypothetical protein TSUD_195740 [Trifolium subterraneum]
MATLHNLILLSQMNSTLFGVYNNPDSRNRFANICESYGRNAVLCGTVQEAIDEIGENLENFQCIVTHMELAQANEFEFAFLDQATVHGAFNHLTLVRWIERLANIHAHYIPQGHQALATLNPQIVNPPVAAQVEVPQNARPALDAHIPAEADRQANAAIQIPLNAQIPPDFGILANIYAQYVQVNIRPHKAMLNAHIPHNVNVPVAAQVEVPQGAPVEEPAEESILALNAQIPAEAHAQANAAIQILNAPVEEPAIQAPAVQHQDVDDDDDMLQLFSIKVLMMMTTSTPRCHSHHQLRGED